MDNCIFCKIINRQAPSYILEETDDVIVFLSLENHPLVVPKKHIVDIYALDEDTGSRIMSELIKISNVVKKGFRCDGVYITQANEAAAGQDVFHVHFHVYPRWSNRAKNDLRIVEDSERESTLRKLKDVLR
jgi:histidine triad (HIT) family protein